MTYCDTCGHRGSDICGTCESLEGVPIKYVNVKYKNDYPCNECANNRNINGICSVCIKPENGRPTKYKTKEEELKENEKKKTHFDEIKAMSIEELADFLEKVADGCDTCPMLKECTYSDGEISEQQIRLKWLKQEVEA